MLHYSHYISNENENIVLPIQLDGINFKIFKKSLNFLKNEKLLLYHDEIDIISP
jgi:hypothetical protein